MSTTVAAWVEAALAASTSDSCVVSVAERHELNLRWANNALTTNGQMHSCTATVVAIAGDAPATVSGPVTSEGELRALVTQADAAAATAPSSEDALPLVDGGVDADFAAPAAVVDAGEFGLLAGQLGEAFAAAAAEGHLLFGFAELHRTTTWLATTAGTRRRFVQPMGRFEFTAKAPDLVNSAWVGQQTNDFTDVDVPALHAELRRRLGWGERRIDLPAGRYETLLSPGCVVDLVFPIFWELSGRDAAEGRTCFAGRGGETRVGERFSPLPLTIATDPHLPGLEVPPFALVPREEPGLTSVFDNGAPVERVEFFADGTLQTLAWTRAGMARRDATGPLPFPADNVLIDAGGTRSLEEMIAATTRGLLVTCLWYIRTVDPQTLLLTGLTRDGVYLIEDGQVVGAVNNFRYNESPLSLLGRVTEVSRAERTLCREWNDWFTRSVAPAMRIPDFQMSTVSQAY